MTKKSDVRGYVTAFVPGGVAESTQRASMTSGAEIYNEAKHGKVIEKFIGSLRQGSVVEVYELHYLAPGIGRADKRRRVLNDRIKTINAVGATICETSVRVALNGNASSGLLHAYEQIATSGRAQKRPKEGRPPIWSTDGPVYESYCSIWGSRLYSTDAERVVAIKQKHDRSPSPSWLRLKIGSPHKVGSK